jgi:hypothetical protein
MSHPIETSVRIFLGVLGILGTLFAPPWIPAVCIVLLALRFSAWEALFIGLAMDLLWLPTGSLLHPFPFFTVGALLLVWALEPLRRQFLIS